MDGKVIGVCERGPEVLCPLISRVSVVGALVKSDYISVRKSTNFTLGMGQENCFFFLLMKFCSILSYDLRSSFKATQFQKGFKMLNFSTCPGYCFTSTSNMTSLIVIFTWFPI